MSNLRSMRMQGVIARVILHALVPAALLACVAGPALAGSEGRKGTAGALELRIPVGARGSALGGAVASDVTGVESMFWNPAGLATVQGTDVLFSHQSYFADMKVNYAGAATNMGGFGVLGVSAKVLSIGDIFVTTEQAPDGTGEVLTPTFTVLGATWARQFTDRVNFGATLNYVSENIVDNTASGVAFDFGVQYATDWHGFRLGMVMKNYGTSMEFSGPGFEVRTVDPAADPNANPKILTVESSRFEMPSFFTLASSYNLQQSSVQRLTALAAFQNNNFSGDNLRAGLEWAYRDYLALRGSYYGSFNGTVDLVTGEETYKFQAGDDLYSGFSLGAGVKTKLGTDSKIGVDFAWKPVKSGTFDDIYELGVNLHF
jgi:hypothetical protein